MALLGASFHLLIEDQGLVLSPILVASDSNQFVLGPWARALFHKSRPAPVPPVTLLVRGLPVVASPVSEHRL